MLRRGSFSRRSAPDPDSVDVAVPPRPGGPLGWFRRPIRGLLCGIREGQNLAMLRMGFSPDTPPLKGCCTVTFSYRARTC